ncbi:MAG TPA: hypothetical protein VFN30_06655 [Chitinophagaceae bacterium]|nr:hypothetical protein [Chitinophagaceae bacterium]
MKNKYLKGAHLSEYKFRELLKLFCEDLTATQIADIINISRVTVNNYLKLIRTHIANYSDKKIVDNYNSAPASLAVFNRPHVSLQNEVNQSKPLFGIYKREGKIATDIIMHPDAKEIINWAKGKTDGLAEEALHEVLRRYMAIADFTNYRLYPVVYNMGIKESQQSDDVVFFWDLLKSRIVKFRGLSGHTLFLHVKETEFRYNHQGANLFEVLSFIIEKEPLHYLRPVKVSTGT